MANTVRMIAANGLISAAAIDARDMAECARLIHGASPTATAAIGRALAIASLIGGALKAEGTSVTLHFKGDGAGGTLLCVGMSDGSARGYAQYPDVDLPRRSDGKLDVGSFVGKKGTLTVIKDLRMKEPYVGTVELLGGEVAEDVAGYFVESEQIPTAIAAGVLVDPDGSVAAAGAYIIQLLPGAGEELAASVEDAVLMLGPVTDLLRSGVSPEGMLRSILHPYGPRVIDEYNAEYRCDCSRERVERALISVGADDLREMIREDGGAEITCRFCDKIYRFGIPELEAMIGGASARRTE